MPRWARVAGIAAIVVLSFALSPLLLHGDKGIGVTFTNRSGQSLCLFTSRLEEPAVEDGSQCPDEIEPESTMTYSTICNLEDMNWVVLTAGAAEIYSRAATCGEWKDSGAQVTRK